MIYLLTRPLRRTSKRILFFIPQYGTETDFFSFVNVFYIRRGSSKCSRAWESSTPPSASSRTQSSTGRRNSSWVIMALHGPNFHGMQRTRRDDLLQWKYSQIPQSFDQFQAIWDIGEIISALRESRMLRRGIFIENRNDNFWVFQFILLK